MGGIVGGIGGAIAIGDIVRIGDAIGDIVGIGGIGDAVTLSIIGLCACIAIHIIIIKTSIGTEDVCIFVLIPA